jgi:hypothetical protein
LHRPVSWKILFFLTRNGPEGPRSAFTPAVGYKLHIGPERKRDLQFYRRDP